MDRATFVKVSAQALEHIEETLADLEHDALDVDLAGDVLTIDFTDGTKFILNAHSAAGQVWMAANKNAWHFDFDEVSRRWIAGKTNDELMATVSRTVGEKLGLDVAL